MDPELSCNFKKCRKRLSSMAWVTSCSHVFCYDDGSREFSKAYMCPACETQLPGKYDILCIDLNPSEQYRSMVLAGLKPDTILDICTRAMSFWTYQVAQESMYKSFVLEKTRERMDQLEQQLENAVNKLTKECQSLKLQLEGCQREKKALCQRVGELNEKLLEKGRLYQKLHSQFQDLRRRSISTVFTPEMRCPTARPDSSLGPTTACDILGRASNMAERHLAPDWTQRSAFMMQARPPLLTGIKERLTPVRGSHGSHGSHTS